MTCELVHRSSLTRSSAHRDRRYAALGHWHPFLFNCVFGTQFAHAAVIQARCTTCRVTDTRSSEGNGTLLLTVRRPFCCRHGRQRRPRIHSRRACEGRAPLGGLHRYYVGIARQLLRNIRRSIEKSAAWMGTGPAHGAVDGLPTYLNCVQGFMHLYTHEYLSTSRPSRRRASPALPRARYKLDSSPCSQYDSITRPAQ